MASKPSHVAFGDFATATDENNFRDWVGTPAQVAAWGAGFSGTPPASAQPLQMMGYAALTTNSSGAITINLPAAFPNGLAWWTANSAGGAGISFRAALTGSSTSAIVFVVYSGTTLLTSAACNVIWEAVGW